MSYKFASLSVLSLATAMLAGSAGVAFAGQKTAILAGGCFWCIEKDFEHVKGVIDVVSGYTGGTHKNPTYKNHPGHREAVKITFDDSRISYDQILHIFWRSVDPTDGGGQFCDRGRQYSTAVYTLDSAQLKTAKFSKQQAEKALGKRVVTEIAPATEFTLSESYHQNYYKKNPLRYKYYRYRCGRDQRVKQLWGEQAYSGVNYGS